MIDAAVKYAKHTVKQALRGLDLDVRRFSSINRFPPRDPCLDIGEEDRALFESVRQRTLSGMERVYALREAVKYVARHNIPGDIVECGVWKGGSMMVVAKTLVECGVMDRKLYLFDTFSGMSEPTEVDKDYRQVTAESMLDSAKDRKETATIWAMAPLDDVKEAMRATGYEQNNIVYVEGMVEDTLPARAPERISLLRLDTDWFESTYHEMQHLFPRLSVGGVLLIDDYGHWQGARQAVDKYLAENNVRILLNRIDYTGRIAVKLEA